MKRFESLIVIAFSLFFLAACNNNPREEALEKQKEALEKEKEAIEERMDIVEEQKEVAEAQREVVEEQKEVYQKKIELRLDEFDARIDVLRAKAAAANVGAAEKAELNKEIDQLVRKKEAARKKLDEIESVSVEGWENFKSGMDATMNDLEESYNRISLRLVE